MRISVIGVGYLGAVHAAAMAQVGHEVVGLDVDAERVSTLNAGTAPFHEPGFEELLIQGLESGRLSFTTDYADLADAQVHFLCLGTPQRPGSYNADLRYLNEAVTSLSTVLPSSPHQHTVVVGKSTVPVGTARELATRLQRLPGVQVMWNPEFLREGHAVKDTLQPDRIVYGVDDPVSDTHPAVALLDEVYASMLKAGTPRLLMGLEAAELVKVSANAFLATKISFINAIAEICETTGADVTDVARAIGMDDRIGNRFLRAGVGFGGGCLPKDIRGFIARAEELGAAQSLAFLREVDAVNQRRRDRVVHLAHEMLGDVRGRTITVLGAAFKPHSDDVRDSPALDIAARLIADGAQVKVTDPAALANAQRRVPALEAVADLDDALRGAELVILLTEWDEYRSIDPHHAKNLVAARRIIDGRGVIDPSTWRAAGWDVQALGRPARA